MRVASRGLSITLNITPVEKNGKRKAEVGKDVKYKWTINQM